MTILWLGQTECHDIRRVGGKAANLSRLATHYPVPAGFCLPVNVFEEATPESAPLPAEVAGAVTAVYEALENRCGRSQPGVAVRSSAIDEDGLDASFAGQLTTRLNVSGAEAILRAIRRCWRSARSKRVRTYRREHGLSPDGARMAILVQQLVPADVSAVAFSVNPVTGEREEIVIDAGWGLGEAIVSGTVTPDTFVVRREDVALISRNISDKPRMIVPDSSGTKEVAVPRLLRRRSSLKEEQVVEVARLSLDLEQRLGWPVDVECAYDEGTLYLLQCRPITTLH